MVQQLPILRAFRQCVLLSRVRFASRSHETGQSNRSRIEGRGGSATEPAVMSSDQAISKLGGAVVPDIQRLLDRGLIFELELRSIEECGNCVRSN
jgi:hypothetical protein